MSISIAEEESISLERTFPASLANCWSLRNTGGDGELLEVQGEVRRSESWGVTITRGGRVGRFFVNSEHNSDTFVAAAI